MTQIQKLLDAYGEATEQIVALRATVDALKHEHHAMHPACSATPAVCSHEAEVGLLLEQKQAEVERLRAESELGSLVRRLPTAFTLFHHPLGWMVERVTEADGSTYREALSADEDPAVAISGALGRHSETF